MAVVAVGVAEQERRALSSACPGDQLRREGVDDVDVLAVHVSGMDAERSWPSEDVAGGRLSIVRVLVVEVVLADVDHGQRPESCHVHHFVEEPLPEGTFAEEADCHLVGAALLCRERRPCCDPRRAADDRVCTQIAVGVVGDVHGAALALAVAGGLAEQLGEHPRDVCPLGETVAVAAMRARDVVVLPKCGADADCNCFLADVEVGEARHLRASVELVHLLLEEPNRRHPTVQVEPGPVDGCRAPDGVGLGLGHP